MTFRQIHVFFVWVSLKTGRFPAPDGRPEGLAQNREAPGETGRLNVSDFIIILEEEKIKHYKQIRFTSLSSDFKHHGNLKNYNKKRYLLSDHSTKKVQSIYST